MVRLCPFVLTGRRGHNDQDGLWVTSAFHHVVEVLTFGELVAEELFGRIWHGLGRALELREHHGLLIESRSRRADQLGIDAPLVLLDQLHGATRGCGHARHVALLKLLHHVRHCQRIYSFDMARAGLADPARTNQFHHWQPPARVQRVPE